MENVSDGLPPPYQPPIYSNFATAASTPDCPMSALSPHAWPKDPPSYSDGFTSVQQGASFQYQPLEDNEADGGGHGYTYRHHQPPTVILHQPSGAVLWGQAPIEPVIDPPNDYMGYSIFVTLCCCWLIGIFAILRSSECRAAIAAGDRATAEIKSAEARSRAHLALALGLVSTTLAVVTVVVYYSFYIISLHK